MSVIDEFVNQFVLQRDDYEKERYNLQYELKKLLNDAGIMAVVSTRTKDPNSLREKLIIRNSTNHYSSCNDIFKDIPDLIGGRIALYYPDDSEKIEPLLGKAFTIVRKKVFPTEQREYMGYNRRFSGYTAIHYRVQVMNPPTKLNLIVEIQVASILMHAWSEVEHDLAYKMRKGDVSYDEYETLDEINGLMIAGETLLQRLQRITDSRMLAEKNLFATHYHLANYIFERAKRENEEMNSTMLGDVESLFRLYEKKSRLSKRKIDNDLNKIDYKSAVPIADQLIDLNTDRISDIKLIIENKAKKTKDNDIIDNQLLLSFLSAYNKLEKEAMNIIISEGKNPNQYPQSKAIDENLFSQYLSMYNFVRIYRNELAHGKKPVLVSELETNLEMANTLIRKLRIINHKRENK